MVLFRGAHFKQTFCHCDDCMDAGGRVTHEQLPSEAWQSHIISSETVDFFVAMLLAMTKTGNKKGALSAPFSDLHSANP